MLVTILDKKCLQKIKGIFANADHHRLMLVTNVTIHGVDLELIQEYTRGKMKLQH